MGVVLSAYNASLIAPRKSAEKNNKEINVLYVGYT